jgi:hypothetical protein
VDPLPGVLGMLPRGRSDSGEELEDQIFARVVQAEVGEDAVRPTDDRRERFGGGQAGEARAVVLDERPATGPAADRVDRYSRGGERDHVAADRTGRDFELLGERAGRDDAPALQPEHDAEQPVGAHVLIVPWV